MNKLLIALLFSVFSSLHPIYVVEMKLVDSFAGPSRQLFINGQRACCMWCGVDVNIKVWICDASVCVGCDKHPDGITPVLDKYK